MHRSTVITALVALALLVPGTAYANPVPDGWDSVSTAVGDDDTGRGGPTLPPPAEPWTPHR